MGKMKLMLFDNIPNKGLQFLELMEAKGYIEVCDYYEIGELSTKKIIWKYGGIALEFRVQFAILQIWLHTLTCK